VISLSQIINKQHNKRTLSKHGPSLFCGCFEDDRRLGEGLVEAFGVRCLKTGSTVTLDARQHLSSGLRAFDMCDAPLS
jgi:hypothetical protein